MGLFFINNPNISLVAASESEEAQTQFQSCDRFSRVAGLMLGVVRRRRPDVTSGEELKNIWLEQAPGKECPRG